MILSFDLTMPNSRHIGYSSYFWATRRFEFKEPAPRIGIYYCTLPENWHIRIAVLPVDEDEAKVIEGNAKGFGRYEWMIDSIIKHGKIVIPMHDTEVDSIS